MKLSNFVGLFLLLIGVAAGVFLVQQVQDYREKAKKPDKYTICHKTGSASNPYVTIEISENALEAHINHGDTVGACPENGEDSGNDEGIGGESGNTSSNDTGGSGGDGDSSSRTGSSGDSGGDASGTQVVTDTKYVYLNPGTLEFYIKFLGVDEKREDKSIRVELRKQEEEVHIYEDVVVSANSSGVYSGTLREVPPGLYNIYIKNINHLQRSFEEVNLVRGFNRWYWNNNQLIPGDLDADNDIDIEDVALFLAEYNEHDMDVTAENINYDLNFDNKIDRKDLTLLLENYQELEVKGEN